MKRHFRQLLLTAAFFSSLPLAAASEQGTTSHKLALLTWKAQAGRVMFVVDAFPASLERTSGYIPLRIAVAVTDKGVPVKITPDSFTLIDAQGVATPVASYSSLMKGYDRRTADQTLFRQYPMQLNNDFRSLRLVGSNFFPPPGGGTRIPAVELGAFTWFRDVLYFPMPAGGIDGTMTLRLSAPGLEAPLDVIFSIKDSASPAGHGAQ